MKNWRGLAFAIGNDGKGIEEDGGGRCTSASTLTAVGATEEAKRTGSRAGSGDVDADDDEEEEGGLKERFGGRETMVKDLMIS